MAAPRLLFLYPMLLRPVETPHLTSRIAISSRAVPRSKRFTTSSFRREAVSSGGQRYGTAQEPTAHLVDGKSVETVKPEPIPSEKPEKSAPADSKEQNDTTVTETKIADSAESMPRSSLPEPPRTPDSKPLETVLHMPSPAEEERQKPPHLKTPPYVHHFDTYGLVKELSKGGYTPDQAITIMKALRGVLTDNMDLARASLVSKSNVENETYLFRAAVSELRTEISNNRKHEVEKMRSERNQLQHEVDILSQRLSQELGSLKDDMKGIFDDRKMTVRQEQRGMESKIQELNYKITIALNSDARSEIEGLRWILTRRAAIAIGGSALMLFAVLKYSSHVSRLQAEEKKRAKKAAQDNASSRNDGPPNPNLKYMDEADRNETLGREVLASEGGISLG